MTTKAAAIQSFMGSFGIPAYPVTSVPDDAETPYLTYTLAVGAWEDGETNVPVDLWYRGESEAGPNAMAERISRRIGMGGVQLPCDSGTVWIKRGSPFSQTVLDEDNHVKRRLINLSVEYNTPY